MQLCKVEPLLEELTWELSTNEVLALWDSLKDQMSQLPSDVVTLRPEKLKAVALNVSLLNKQKLVWYEL